MTKRKLNFGNIEGTSIPIFKSIKYGGKSGQAADLKFMRDTIKYWKIFPDDLRNSNYGKLPGVIQMDHAWHWSVRFVVDRGCSCGKFGAYTFMFIVYLFALMDQMTNSDAKKYWLQRREEDRSLDIQPFFDQPSLPYVHDHLYWILYIINKCSPEVRARVNAELLPNADPAMFDGSWDEEKLKVARESYEKNLSTADAATNADEDIDMDDASSNYTPPGSPQFSDDGEEEDEAEVRTDENIEATLDEIVDAVKRFDLNEMKALEQRELDMME